MYTIVSVGVCDPMECYHAWIWLQSFAPSNQDSLVNVVTTPKVGASGPWNDVSVTRETGIENMTVL